MRLTNGGYNTEVRSVSDILLAMCIRAVLCEAGAALRVVFVEPAQLGFHQLFSILCTARLCRLAGSVV